MATLSESYFLLLPSKKWILISQGTLQPDCVFYILSIYYIYVLNLKIIMLPCLKRIRCVSVKLSYVGVFYLFQITTRTHVSTRPPTSGTNVAPTLPNQSPPTTDPLPALEHFHKRSHVYYWYKCGSDPSQPVTAYYRPTASSKTFP